MGKMCGGLRRVLQRPRKRDEESEDRDDEEDVDGANSARPSRVTSRQFHPSRVSLTSPYHTISFRSAFPKVSTPFAHAHTHTHTHTHTKASHAIRRDRNANSGTHARLLSSALPLQVDLQVAQPRARPRTTLHTQRDRVHAAKRRVSALQLVRDRR